MNYTELDAYMRYFYHIDTHKLADKIKIRISKNVSNSPDMLFPLIFSEIEQACEPYLKFIYSPHSFNHSDKASTFTMRTPLLQQVLKNHCITHGFLTSLKKEQKTLTIDTSEISIRGSNDIKLKTGYFATKHFSVSPTLLPDGREQNSDIARYYNGYKHRFTKFANSYSYRILGELFPKRDNNNFLKVPSHFGNPSCFIFTNLFTHVVDNNISTKRDVLLKNYSNLLSECIDWCKNNRLISEDKLLLEYVMEALYGFSFFAYAVKLLNRIHTSDSDSIKITLKDFEGSIMLNLIQQTAQLPITYNCSVFLEHCLYSVISSKYLNAQEYQRKNTSLFSHTSRKPAPKELLIISGFDHIEKYLQKLKYIAIPLLESLWDLMIEKLNNDLQNSKELFINTDTYQAYIKSHYSMITQDYSLFFTDEKTLSEFSEDSLYHTDSSKNPDTLYQSCDYKTISSSKYERESFKQLLLDYFKPERLIVPQPTLYDLLMPTSDINYEFSELSKHTEELNFHKYYYENILSFAESITPFIR